MQQNKQCYAIHLEGLGWWSDYNRGWQSKFDRAKLYQNEYRARQHCRGLLKSGWIDNIDDVSIITYNLSSCYMISGEQCLRRGNE